MKVPAYYVLKDFKKYDWSIDVDPGEPKSEDKLVVPTIHRAVYSVEALVFT